MADSDPTTAWIDGLPEPELRSLARRLFEFSAREAIERANEDQLRDAVVRSFISSAVAKGKKPDRFRLSLLRRQSVPMLKLQAERQIEEAATLVDTKVTDLAQLRDSARTMHTRLTSDQRMRFAASERDRASGGLVL